MIAQEERNDGSFSREKYTNETFFLYNSKYAVGRGLNININSKSSKKPDIAIWKIENIVDVKNYIESSVPDYAIEINIYCTDGKNCI